MKPMSPFKIDLPIVNRFELLNIVKNRSFIFLNESYNVFSKVRAII